MIQTTTFQRSKIVFFMEQKKEMREKEKVWKHIRTPKSGYFI